LPLIEVAAAAICADGQLLALRRSPNQPMGGYWELPGGKLENGESPAECLRRELSEELSIQIEDGEFLGCHCHSDTDKSISLCVFLVMRWQGQIALSVHDRMRWLAPDEFMQIEWAPADIPHLAEIGRRLQPAV